MALRAATFVLHPLASSSVLHKVSNIKRDPSAGQILTRALMALVTADRTGCPLSILKPSSMGMRGIKTPSTPVPKDRHVRSTRTGADSRSYPDLDEAHRRTTSKIFASCRAWSVFGDFLRLRAIESAMDLASTLLPADARAVSSSRTGDAGSCEIWGAATGDMVGMNGNFMLGRRRKGM